MSTLRWRRRCIAMLAAIIGWFLTRMIQPIGISPQSQPQSTSTKPQRSLDVNLSLSYDYDPDEPAKICGITAMFGDYELTAKEPKEPQVPSFPLFLFTDQEHLLNETAPSAWTRVRLNDTLWQKDCVKQEYIGARNNPCEQPFLFNLAKFYKMQFYRVPQLREAGCNVVVWLDATVQIKVTSFMGRMADRAERGQNFVVYVQDGPRKGFKTGEVGKEARNSKFGKYGGKQPGSFGPPQNVEEQYDRYVSEGFREKWFANSSWFDEYKGVGNDMKYGLYMTCMVMFDLRKKETKQFLDCWWEQNILRSTQDQVSFPYCAWKLNTRIHALPDKEEPTEWDPTNMERDDNPYFRKLGHGL